MRHHNAAARVLGVLDAKSTGTDKESAQPGCDVQEKVRATRQQGPTARLRWQLPLSNSQGAGSSPDASHYAVTFNQLCRPHALLLAHNLHPLRHGPKPCAAGYCRYCWLAPLASSTPPAQIQRVYPASLGASWWPCMLVCAPGCRCPALAAWLYSLEAPKQQQACSNGRPQSVVSTLLKRMVLQSAGANLSYLATLSLQLSRAKMMPTVVIAMFR